MRYGFTTGSCAAAAAKAAAYMLLSGREKAQIAIETPKGILYTAQIVDIKRREGEVSCAVEKDGGDDPDVTTGALIYAKVTTVSEAPRAGKNSMMSEAPAEGKALEEKRDALGAAAHAKIFIEGGIGVGRVTRPGLDQPVGSAAINHVPREMIEKEVMQVCEMLDYTGSLQVEISVPEGERIAERTFNGRLGIVGGISILGTSGIVEPMSSQAILDTIQVELNQRRAEGFDYVVISPGNYGQDYIKKTYGYDLERSVKCSNFIGDTIDMAVGAGFQKILLIGHIGKLIKVAGGIMNTHSKEGDCRMELLAAFAVKCGAGADAACRILECVTTEEAVHILEGCSRRSEVMDYAMERICYYLDKRAGGNLKMDCIMYANETGELAKSKEADKWFTLLAQEQARRI